MVLRDRLSDAFSLKYFPSAMPIGDILNTSNGGSLKGPKNILY